MTVIKTFAWPDEVYDKYLSVFNKEKKKSEKLTHGAFMGALLDRWNKNGGTYDANNKIRREIDK